MAAVTYLLCALTSLACSVLLFRAWLSTRARLLFWSTLCFVALTFNNVLLVVDKLVMTDVSLATWRLSLALAALILMIIGLVWEE